MPLIISDLMGTLLNMVQMGDRTSGNKILRFYASSTGDLRWNPTSSRSIDLPDASGIVALAQRPMVFSHFLGGLGEFVSVTSNGGTVTTGSVADTGNVPGIAQIATGAISTMGAAWLGTNANALKPGYGKCVFETYFQINTLSTSADAYTLRLGFQDTNNGESANASYFRYTNTGSTPNWQVVCRRGGLEQAITTSFVADTNWHKLRVEFNSNLSVVTFTYDSATQTISGTPPTSTSALGAACLVIKSAGLNSRTFNADYLYCEANII